MLGVIAGTVLLGVVLPAALRGVVDPVLVWLVFAIPALTIAVVLGWRWSALRPSKGRHPSLVIASCLLLAVLAMAGFAVT